MTGWTTADLLPQTGKSFVITGATSGIGLETAKALAGAGGAVLLTGRNQAKGVTALATIRAAHPDAQIAFARCDVADLSSVNKFADGMLAHGRPFDALINNAGIMAPPQRIETVDGFEGQLGTNVIGHYLLTARILPLLQATPAPRIVHLASLAHLRGRIFLDDLNAERSYNPWARYQQSKLAMLLFAQALQRHSDAGGWGIASVAAHPGLAATNLFRRGPEESLYARLRTGVIDLLCQDGAAGAWPVLMAATAPDVQGGGYYGPTGFLEIRGKAGPARIGSNARDPVLGERLWEALLDMSNTRWPTSSAPPDPIPPSS